MASSISSVPTTRSSVAETGKFTKASGAARQAAALAKLRRARYTRCTNGVGSCGSQPKRQPAMASSSGRSAAKARAAVDLAVPRSPRMSTPPMRGSTALSTRARRSAFLPYNGGKGINNALIHQNLFLKAKFTIAEGRNERRYI